MSAAQYFNRYQYFEHDGNFKIVPGIQIPISTTDQYIQYKKGRTRLDKVSDENYNSPFFGWLIMLANPLAGNMEHDIPDNFILRIPMPLISALHEYKRNIDTYNLYYGE